jgi:hypothetical protein
MSRKPCVSFRLRRSVSCSATSIQMPQSCVAAQSDGLMCRDYFAVQPPIQVFPFVQHAYLMRL